MKRKVVFLSILFLSLFACKKDDDEITPELIDCNKMEALFVGEIWNYIYDNDTVYIIANESGNFTDTGKSGQFSWKYPVDSVCTTILVHKAVGDITTVYDVQSINEKEMIMESFGQTIYYFKE